MLLSDTSIKRPVFASVIGLLLIAVGIVSFTRLPLREYPDVDPPIVTIRTTYPGASANVIENRITEVIEDRIAGVPGINFINSSSQDGSSQISIEFDISRPIDAAANDVRDRVSGILRALPVDADPPDVQKADASEETVLVLNLASDKMGPVELTDYAERYLVDRFSSIDGVARVQIGGQRSPAMRIWLDRRAMAARGLTANDIERAVRSENIETPAGSLTSQDLVFTARIDRAFRTPEQFANLVVGKGKDDGVLIRLGDIARVEFGPEEDRNINRSNGQQTLGIAIVKQSTSNVVQVAQEARKRAGEIAKTLPAGMSLDVQFDTSVFVDASIHEVFMTLGIAVALVIGVIFLFLGSWRATIVPAVTVPVSLIATFTVLYALGLSINLLTLLALVLAIGLVVDDAIVVLENIHRRIEEEGESPLVAAFRGTRQVGFAVVATTLVLISVFVPITFMQGQMGRLFAEFAIAIAAAVAFSMLVALTISPMLASKLMKPHSDEAKSGGFAAIIDKVFAAMRRGYSAVYDATVRRPLILTAAFFALLGGSVYLFTAIQSEYTPQEDRGQFIVMINAPEGASFEYTKKYIDEIEARLLPMVGKGEIERIAVRAPGFGPSSATFNSGMVQVMLTDFGKRRNGFDIVRDINRTLQDIPGVRVSAVMPSAFGRGGGGGGQPIQFVIGGPSYETLVQWRNTFVDALNADNPGIANIDWDFKETQQQYRINIDYDRASDLGVTVQEIGATLQTMLGSKRVGTFIQSGEERNVIFEGERIEQSTPNDLENIYVRSARSQELIPLSNLVKVTPMADSRRLNRYNRVRAITISAMLQPGVSLGDALDKMEATARRVLPPEVKIDYKGQSLDYKRAGSSIGFVFIFGILVVFLVLAAQFESWIHPIVIMLCVPATVGGGLLGLYVTHTTLNIYSQIGLIMLVGLAAKNGILIVEFANQLRDRGMAFEAAIREAALTRFRPILMTTLTAVAGALPLIFSHGAGSETRSVIGIVILFGVTAALLVTLVLVPAAYSLLARHTGSPKTVERRLAREEREQPDHAETEDSAHAPEASGPRVQPAE